MDILMNITGILEYNSSFNATDSNTTGLPYRDANAGRMVNLILRPILIVFGTIGNLLSFYVMRQGSLKKVSTCFYMSILALADTGLLWFGALVGWILHLTHGEVNPMTWTDCKLGLFLFCYFRHLSSALLFLMCIEKFLALYFPLRTKTICTVKTAKWVSVITVLILFAYNAHIFFVFHKNKNNKGYSSCQISPTTYEITFNRIDSTFYSFLPFLLMIITNFAIIYKLMKAKFTSKRGGIESTSKALSKSATKGTAMLITISMMFIILTGPIAIGIVVTISPHPLFNAIIIIMQYTNHSINGVLYCIVGPKFRREMFKRLGLSRNNRIGDLPSTNTDNHHTATASPM